jgi:tRNA1Val (adenine37-N6)-methyltransferase
MKKTSTRASFFQFKQFKVHQDQCAMKVGTDGVMLGAWVDVHHAQTVLDIGTGTGLIALMLAQRNANARIDAVEIDADACGQASENMQATPWANRLHCFHQSVQAYAQACPEQYDLIVSNPPFFTGGVLSESDSKTQVRHTVKLPHGDLLQAVTRLLSPHGRFAVVLPLLEGLRFTELALRSRLYCEHLTEVHTRSDKPVSRLLLQFIKQVPEHTRKDKLIVQDKATANAWTADFQALVDDFYL